jgi:hypothetical protein
MKKLVLISLVLFSFQYIQAQDSYHVKNKVTVKNVDNQLTRLAFILPLAKTNQYQTVTNVEMHGGQMVDIPETDDSYLRWTMTSDLPPVQQSAEIYYEFDVTMNKIDFDFSKISTIYPYDKNSDIYNWYTGTSGDYVDPNNAAIQRIGNSLWAKSTDIIDYAKRCYEYTAANYKYVNPFTGLHTLQQILNDGGGDCGNLTSIFVSLLRYKNIPARHVVTVRPDGVYHVWADFYLEKYGWVPVDVTYKNSDPKGNYFGKYDGTGIVMSKEVWLPIEKGNGESYYSDILQSYTLWMWKEAGTQLSSSHELISSSNQVSADAK